MKICFRGIITGPHENLLPWNESNDVEINFEVLMLCFVFYLMKRGREVVAWSTKAEEAEKEKKKLAVGVCLIVKLCQQCY